MAIPATQILQAELILSGMISSAGGNSVRTDNVFHYSRISTVTAPSKAALSAAFQGAVVAPLAACLNHRWSATLVSVRWMNDPTDQALPFNCADVGAIAGDSMPSDNYVFMSIKCGLKGGNFLGNKKIGPISESDSTTGTDDILNAAALARFNTLATAMLTSITDASPNTWNMGVWSRTLQEQIVLPSVAIVQATAIAINQRISSMKKRRVKSVY
jgi:hypothetical protein